MARGKSGEVEEEGEGVRRNVSIFGMDLHFARALDGFLCLLGIEIK